MIEVKKKFKLGADSFPDFDNREKLPKSNFRKSVVPTLE